MTKIYSLELNKTKKLILYILKELSEGTEEKELHLTLQQLSFMASVSRNTVSQIVKQLQEQGLIEVVSGQGKAPNTYKLKI